jgi:hypothetical protein
MTKVKRGVWYEASTYLMAGESVKKKIPVPGTYPGASAVRTLRAGTVTVMHMMNACFQATAAKKLRTALFWVVT